MALTTRTVTATYQRADGTPASGEVWFSPNVTVSSAAEDLVVPPLKVRAQLDAQGGISMTLVCTDNAGLLPSGWAYTVAEYVHGVTDRTYLANIPAGSGSLDLADISHLETPPATAEYLRLSGGTLTGELVLDDASPAASEAYVATHEADTTGVHGIADTSALETVTGSAAKVATHTGATDPHGDRAFTTSSISTHAVAADPHGDRADAATKYIPLAGGTIDGDLTIGSATAGRNLNVISGYVPDSGQDDSDGVDYTGRLNLYSYQRAAFHSYGEVLRIYSRKWDSKQMIAWYGPTSYTAYDPVTDTGGDPVGTDKPWFWMGAHYESNDHGSVHGHWSCEVPDSSGALQTRFEFKIWDPVAGTYGMDKTNILTNATDLTVRCTNGQVLRLSATDSHHKDIQFGLDHDGADAFQRWRLRVTSTTADFQVLRYNDTGVLQDAPIAVSRSTGKVSIGGASGTSQGLDVLRSGGTVMNVTQSGAGTALNLFGADTAVRAFQAQVTGDPFGRFVVMTTGETQWGSGAAGRDTNLYRSAADTLKTDDAFHVGTQFRHLGASLGFYNATAIAKPTVSGSRANPEQALANVLTALANLGLVTNSTGV